jgi:hypothetical protein
MTRSDPALMSSRAIVLAKAGWRVFPVDAETKRPRNMHGHLDATTDLKKIKIWRNQFDTGGAIATPTGDGLLVVDIDPRNGGEVPTWAPATRTVRTQSGGFHLHYAIDEDIVSRAGLFGPGVDSKCRGGYVLIPPSPGYSWVNQLPRAGVTAAWLGRYFTAAQGSGGPGEWAKPLPPEQWQRGIIHDQALAWAAYFAHLLDDEQDVVDAVNDVIRQAVEAGCQIDNAGNHIGQAIQWVLRRERAKRGPSID